MHCMHAIYSCINESWLDNHMSTVNIRRQNESNELLMAVETMSSVP